MPYDTGRKPKSPFLGEMGRQIAKRREMATPSLSQEELAAKAGVNRPNLTNIELGRVDAQIETIRKLTQALGITLSEFFRDLG